MGCVRKRRSKRGKEYSHERDRNSPPTVNKSCSMHHGQHGVLGLVGEARESPTGEKRAKDRWSERREVASPSSSDRVCGSAGKGDVVG